VVSLIFFVIPHLASDLNSLSLLGSLWPYLPPNSLLPSFSEKEGPLLLLKVPRETNKARHEGMRQEQGARYIGEEFGEGKRRRWERGRQESWLA
jgi:hypothetical protein